MKREELIEYFHKAAESANACADYHRSEFASGQANAYEAAAEFIEGSFPATSITLQLPVYAAGDPKAGEVVPYKSVVYFYFELDGRWVPSQRWLSFIEFDGDWSKPRWHGLFSTAAARDAALKAAEEAASNGN